jgi:hypothetical protein
MRCKMVKRSTEAIERDLLKKSKKSNKKVSIRDMLSSGSTMMNLACTGRPAGCFVRGKYYWFVGDSASGKTFLVLTCLAEACMNTNFDDYDLIYDNVEDGALMDMERFFGKRVVKRLRPPGYDSDGNPVYSVMTEDFYYFVDDANKRGRRFIYVLDSMDALDTKADAKHFDKGKKQQRKPKEGEKETGSFGTAKPKLNSTYLRKVLSKIRDSGSILIVISQTRDNLGFGAMFNPKVVSGGRALKFYATLEIWSSVKEQIKEKIRGKNRQLGILSKVQIKKNRVTGRDRTVFVPIYHSYGIDDIGSCVDYLIGEEHWEVVKGKIKVPEFDFIGGREKLIKFIESENLEPDLRSLAGRVWNEIEQECNVERKRRYD